MTVSVSSRSCDLTSCGHPWFLPRLAIHTATGKASRVHCISLVKHLLKATTTTSKNRLLIAITTELVPKLFMYHKTSYINKMTYNNNHFKYHQNTLLHSNKHLNHSKCFDWSTTWLVTATTKHRNGPHGLVFWYRHVWCRTAAGADLKLSLIHI